MLERAIERIDMISASIRACFTILFVRKDFAMSFDDNAEGPEMFNQRVNEVFIFLCIFQPTYSAKMSAQFVDYLLLTSKLTEPRNNM